MRCELVALALAACGYTDVDRPIGLIPHGLSDVWVANLEEAGACWNLEFGTHFVTGDAALHADQQVDVAFDDATCLQAPAQVQPGTPTSLGICPERYWPGLDGPYLLQYITPFRVLSHELGHVLNMVGHPDDSRAVMRSGDADFLPMFHAVDRERFVGANPDFHVTSPCAKVIRSYRPGAGDTVSHCACEQGEIDVTQPLALVPSPQLGASFADQLASVASCWNVRYGLALEVRTPQPGDPRADIERCGNTGGYGRALDGNSVMVCIESYEGTEFAIARIFAVPGAYYVFPNDTDAAMASRYHVDVHCQNVVLDATNRCACAD